MKTAIGFITLVFLIGCTSVKNRAFYSYEYSKNYKIKMSPAPNWIVHNSIEYTKEEKQNLQADIPLSIQFVLNTCDRKVKAIRFLPEGLDNNLEDKTKIKIVETLKINIEFLVLPIREEKPISCDTSLIFNMWIK